MTTEEEVLAYRCLKLKGKHVQYRDENGKMQCRILENVIKSSSTNKPVAVFKYNDNSLVEIFKKGLLGTKNVPIHKVILPTEPKVSNHGHQQTKFLGSPRKAKQFNYYGEWYQINIWQDFKAGDEVVWSKFSTKEIPCLGKVVVTAERPVVTGDVDVVAVVKLEVPPGSVNGCNPPRRFTQYDGVYNTYLIPLSELLKLDEWIEITKMTLISEAEYQQDLLGANDEDREDTQRGESETKSVGIYPGQPDSTNVREKSNSSRLFGIQGNNNSCYIDSSLFALFAFTNFFDHYLVDESTAKTAKQILKQEIVNTLRTVTPFVAYENVEKLRKILSTEINPQYSQQFMDAEEFLCDFFKLLGIPPFILYENEESDHIHQIALPFTWTPDQYTNYLSLQTLLENSFETFEIKLENPPRDIFVIKLPVSNGVLIPCKGVVPNLELDLTKILKPGPNHESKSMKLQSIICLRKSHFVAFVRIEKEDNTSSWMFMDSNPTTQKPRVEMLPDVDKRIRESLNILGTPSDHSNITVAEPTAGRFSLFQHAYICIYKHSKYN